MQGDLVVLVPDRNTEAVFDGLLARHQSLRMRTISSRILVHPEKDPGCRLHGHELLRIHQGAFKHALLVFDREGSGDESMTREQMESEAEKRLAESGWKWRAAAVIIDPELDIWVWSDSPVVEELLGWPGRSLKLRAWLKMRGFEFRDGVKPIRPKEALQAARDEVRRPRSSSLYKELALKVSLDRCADPAFVKLRTKLEAWFGSQPVFAVPPGN